MVAYLYKMPSGGAGFVSRNAPNATIEPKFLDNTAKPAYGAPVKLVNGKVTALAAGDAATVIYGLLARPYPTSSGTASLTSPFGPETPPDQAAGVLKRGYMTVLLRSGTAAPGGTVYVRVGAATSDKPLGGIEAAADSTNTVVLPNAYFNGAVDSYGIVEIAYNL